MTPTVFLRQKAEPGATAVAAVTTFPAATTAADSFPPKKTIFSFAQGKNSTIASPKSAGQQYAAAVLAKRRYEVYFSAAVITFLSTRTTARSSRPPKKQAVRPTALKAVRPARKALVCRCAAEAPSFEAAPPISETTSRAFTPPEAHGTPSEALRVHGSQTV